MCLPKSLKQSIQLGAELHGMLGCWDAGMLGAELLGMLQCWKLEWPPPGCGGGEQEPREVQVSAAGCELEAHASGQI